jgi:phage terminase small subunit
MTLSDLGLTARQEAFAYAIASQQHATDRDAAIHAGYGPAGAEQRASENRRKPSVTTAIARLTDSQRERHEIDLDWLTTRYKRIFTESMTAGEYTSARQALDSIAKQHGLAGDSHSTVDVKHSGAVALESLPLETLSQLLDAIDQQSTTLAIEAPDSPEILTPESGS